MALTGAKTRNLKPKERPYKIADFDGLYIHVTLKGSKLWRLKYRILGKEKLLAIGVYPEVSLLTARKVRAEVTMKKNRWYLDMAISDFGNRPLAEITSPIVLRCLRKPEGRGR